MAKRHKQQKNNRTVWVLGNTYFKREPMKEDSFGYSDWEIYYGV